MACSTQKVHIWDIQTQKIKNTLECSTSKDELYPIYDCKSVKRDPHNPNLLSYIYGKRFNVVDLRDSAKIVNKGAIVYSP